MSEFGSMLESTFEHSTPAIFAEVEHIVSDGQSRKTCRLAGLRTDRGEMVAEIIRTSLGPVVVYRSDTGEFNTQDDSYRPWRQDRRRVIGPLTGDPDQTFDLMDKSGERYRIKARDFSTRTFTFRGHAGRLSFV